MSTILVAAEAAWVRELVRSSCTGPGQRVVEVVRGQDVRAAVTAEEPELVILDMQIANQGGVATAIDLRLEASAGRLPDTAILLLLDREADRFLAQRAAVEGVAVKPVDAGQLRRVARAALDAAVHS